MGGLFNLPGDLDPCNPTNNLQTTMFSPLRWEFRWPKTGNFPERVRVEKEAVVSRRKMELVKPRQTNFHKVGSSA